MQNKQHGETRTVDGEKTFEYSPRTYGGERTFDGERTKGGERTFDHGGLRHNKGGERTFDGGLQDKSGFRARERNFDVEETVDGPELRKSNG